MGDRGTSIVLAGNNAATEAAKRLRTIWANLPEHPPGFTKDIFDRFDDIDHDGDGFIDLGEVDRACSSRSFSGHQAAAVATLKKVLDELEDLHDDEIGLENDGVARGDLAGLDMREVADPDDELVKSVRARYEAAKSKIAASPRTVFVDDDAPTVDPETCRQGIMGDCFFLAPLIALAFTRVDDLLAMITRKSSLEWRVEFPGADHAVRVETPTDAEIALFASADGLWPVVFEMAFGKYFYSSVYGLLSRSRIDPVDNSKPMGIAMEILTGSSIDHDFLNTASIASTRAKLIEAMDNRKIVCAGIGKLPFQDKDVAGLRRGHAYSILAFDAETDVVTLRNPWGTSDELDSGIVVDRGKLDLPLDELDRIFSFMYYEE